MMGQAWSRNRVASSWAVPMPRGAPCEPSLPVAFDGQLADWNPSPLRGLHSNLHALERLAGPGLLVDVGAGGVENVLPRGIEVPDPQLVAGDLPSAGSAAVVDRVPATGSGSCGPRPAARL